MRSQGLVNQSGNIRRANEKYWPGVDFGLVLNLSLTTDKGLLVETEAMQLLEAGRHEHALLQPSNCLIAVMWSRLLRWPFICPFLCRVIEYHFRILTFVT